MKKTIMAGLVFLLALCFCRRQITEPIPDQSYNWPTATPESQGFDAQKLNTALQEADRRQFIYAILLIRNGHLIAERYYKGFDRVDAHNIRSVSKSFLSVLYGIALERGHISSLEQKIMDFLPEYKNAVNDPRFQNITLRHLLTMSSGIPGDQEIYFKVTTSPDWVRSIVSQQLAFNPGTSHRYTTAGTHLLSVALSKSSGMTTAAFAEQFLLMPLKITLASWSRDPQGNYFGGTDMSFAPRDMARLGELYLNNGTLGGVKIVPSQWVAQSTAQYYSYKNNVWGAMTNLAYGHLWWLGEIANQPCFFALGHGGQFILVFPGLKLVITTVSFSDTSDWDLADRQERSVLDVVANYIMPALKE